MTNNLNKQKSISTDATVGELVAKNPQFAAIFEESGIDYCCGGKKTLRDACSQKGISAKDLLERLISFKSQSLSADGTDWTTANLGDLIDHIIDVYHRPLRNDLARVVQLAEKVARVHGANHPEMVEVASIFKVFGDDLEMHMQKEELILFPAIKSLELAEGPKHFGCGGGIERPIQVMTEEHDAAGEAIAKFRKLTNNYLPPSDACNTFKVLLHSLESIESEMHQHVHKENNILFPRALAKSNEVTN